MGTARAVVVGDRRRRRRRRRVHLVNPKNVKAFKRDPCHSGGAGTISAKYACGSFGCHFWLS